MFTNITSNTDFKAMFEKIITETREFTKTLSIRGDTALFLDKNKNLYVAGDNKNFYSSDPKGIYENRDPFDKTIVDKANWTIELHKYSLKNVIDFSAIKNANSWRLQAVTENTKKELWTIGEVFRGTGGFSDELNKHIIETDYGQSKFSYWTNTWKKADFSEDVERVTCNNDSTLLITSNKNAYLAGPLGAYRDYVDFYDNCPNYDGSENPQSNLKFMVLEDISASGTVGKESAGTTDNPLQNVLYACGEYFVFEKGANVIIKFIGANSYLNGELSLPKEKIEKMWFGFNWICYTRADSPYLKITGSVGDAFNDEKNNTPTEKDYILPAKYSSSKYAKCLSFETAYNEDATYRSHFQAIDTITDDYDDISAWKIKKDDIDYVSFDDGNIGTGNRLVFVKFKDKSSVVSIYRENTGAYIERRKFQDKYMEISSIVLLNENYCAHICVLDNGDMIYQHPRGYTYTNPEDLNQINGGVKLNKVFIDL